ncbi:MAG: serine/threonine protein kinase [Lachnospiraceae bacterium]|nr:serine/threonine protein kinase [Lachnospiraceae bacterium]
MNTNDICMSCMVGKLNNEKVCLNCKGKDSEIQNNSRHLPLRTILNGKYLVGKVLGEGGFGITYIGFDLNLEIRVAIKEFCPREYAGRDATDSQTILPFDKSSEEIFEAEKSKFLKEARNLAKFRNETNVVSVLDYFVENGTAYIVMDYIDGITLRTYAQNWKQKEKRMPLESVLELLQPIMEVLEKIHKENIVHRDISPDNIMIEKYGKEAYLIDFGTARDYVSSHSMSSYQKGSYTPLEQQSRKGEQGPWTDVYALCATIYVCITGKTIPLAVDRIMEDDLIPPHKLGIQISQKQESALMRGLALLVEDRISSIKELREALYEDVSFLEKMSKIEEKEEEKAEENVWQKHGEETEQKRFLKEEVSVKATEEKSEENKGDLETISKTGADVERTHRKRRWKIVFLSLIIILLIVASRLFIYRNYTIRKMPGEIEVEWNKDNGIETISLKDIDYISWRVMNVDHKSDGTKIISKCDYQNGKKSVEHIEEQGVIKQKIYYNLGDDGKEVRTYVSDNHYTFEVMDNEGMVKRSGVYKSGRLIESTWYYNNGDICSIEYQDENNYHSIRTNSEGVMLKEYFVKNGEIVEKIEY